MFVAFLGYERNISVTDHFHLKPDYGNDEADKQNTNDIFDVRWVNDNQHTFIPFN